MSFYNLVHGQNPASDWLLGLLDLTREDVGRFRDAWVEKDGAEIHVYTRNGGGNRECYHDENPTWGNEHCKHHTVEEEVDEVEKVPIGTSGYTYKATGRRVMETHYVCEAPDSADCACTGCTIVHRLPKHPLYLYDRDDDFDCTYATVVFRAPEAAVPLLKDLSQSRDPDEEWAKALRALQEGKRPDVVERMAPMLSAITRLLESKS